MKPLLIAILLFGLSPFVHGHGVERGFMEDAMSRMHLSAQTRDLISTTLAARCDLSRAQAARGEAFVTTEMVDQGARDYYYTLRFEMSLEGEAEPAAVLVRAAEYAISNPAIENAEVLSVESPLCR